MFRVFIRIILTLSLSDVCRQKIYLYFEDIDLYTLQLSLAERIIIYNKLNQPFVVEQQKYIDLLEDSFLKNINTMIYIFMKQDINTKDVEKYIKIIEEKTKNLKYEEKFMIYNKLGHMLFKIFVKEIG